MDLQKRIGKAEYKHMKKNRLLALLMSVVMCFTLIAPALAEDVLLIAPAPSEEGITILYTNDIHTYIDGDIRYSTIAAYKDTFEDVLLVDAGDHAQGTAYGSMDKGATIIDLMNAAGYDVATLGNHEFDYGMDGCMNLIDRAEFTYVSSNFYHENDGVAGESVLDSYVVYEIDGMKIAIIGITTPESFTKSTPAYFQDENGNYIYGIAGGDDGSALYARVQEAIDLACAEADVVIALGHLGDDLASRPWTSEELIANTTGLDAFIDGHSHSTVEGKLVADKDGNEVLLTQTGEYFGAIGKMTITENGITTELVTAEELAGLEPDADVKALEDAWMADVDGKLDQVIGSIDDTLNNYDENGERLVRKQETNTGDFVTDALYYLFDNMGMDVDFAIMNGGGIRNKAITGEITYKTCKNIHTFGNVACLQTITGQQILDALEWGARDVGKAEVGGFLHVSGLKYTIDTSIESTVQKDEKGVWIGGPTGEYRVKDVLVLNNKTGEWEPLDLTAEYNLAGYNYTLRDLGDGFAMFDGAVNVLDYVMEDYMVLANYVASFENGKVTGYGEVQGRITILTAEEEADDGKILVGGLENNLWTTKYGNLYCDCKAEDFVAMGYTWGDLVKVKFLDQELILPVVPTYSYVDSGKPAIIMGKTDTGAPTGYLSFAINMGNFTGTYGIATKQTDENGNWWWTANEGVTFPMEITFELAEAGGYMAEYILHELVRTNNREDYAHLTDEQFANFRVVATNGMGTAILYRSSSPINPEIGRNAYADAAIRAAGVKTIINLADSSEDTLAYAGYADTYYSQQNVTYLSLGVDFAADDFQYGLAVGLRYMAENEGPYLIHCTEGKDRAGFVTALLECLMGATYDEVVADYMVTYYNYYGVEPGSEKYNAIAQSNIIKSLQQAFGVADLTAADLQAEAKEYLLAIGLTEEEIGKLVNNLMVDRKTMNFADIAVNDWFYDEVKYVFDKGLMSGTSDTTFNPQSTTTRAMLVTILWRLEGEPVVNYAMSFTDVPADKWYTEAVRWAAANKIVNGHDEKTFAPDGSITREQMATILYNYAKFKGYDVSAGEDTNILSYTDAFNISGYAVSAMQWACGEGLINGVDNALLPGSNATRAQIATILMRFCENIAA